MPNDRTQVIVPKNILPTSFLPKPPTVHSGHTLLRDVSKTHLVILTYDPERSNTGSDRYTYVRILPRPALFLIFSVANYYWDSLQKHMPRYKEWLNRTEN